MRENSFPKRVFIALTCENGSCIQWIFDSDRRLIEKESKCSSVDGKLPEIIFREIRR